LLAELRLRASASSRNWLLVQSFWPVEVPRSLVPRSRFAVGHFLGCAVFLRRTAPATSKQPAHPLGEFRLPSECCPTDPSPPAAASRLLSWALAPFSTCRAQRSTRCGQCRRPLGSVLRVWSPSRRLTPSESGPALFHAGSAPGILPFEAFPARKVSLAFPRATHPPAVCSRRLFPPP
jgi:hypothetical protein